MINFLITNAVIKKMPIPCDIILVISGFLRTKDKIKAMSINKLFCTMALSCNKVSKARDFMIINKNEISHVFGKDVNSIIEFMYTVYKTDDVEIVKFMCHEVFYKKIKGIQNNKHNPTILFNCCNMGLKYVPIWLFDNFVIFSGKFSAKQYWIDKYVKTALRKGNLELAQYFWPMVDVKTSHFVKDMRCYQCYRDSVAINNVGNNKLIEWVRENITPLI